MNNMCTTFQAGNISELTNRVLQLESNATGKLNHVQFLMQPLSKF